MGSKKRNQPAQEPLVLALDEHFSNHEIDETLASMDILPSTNEFYVGVYEFLKSNGYNLAAEVKNTVTQCIHNLYKARNEKINDHETITGILALHKEKADKSSGYISWFDSAINAMDIIDEYMDTSHDYFRIAQRFPEKLFDLDEFVLKVATAYQNLTQKNVLTENVK